MYRPELVSYENGIAAFRLDDGELVRIPGLTAEGARDGVHEIRSRGSLVFVTLRYTSHETPTLRARRVDQGGRIIGRPHGV
jgi:hypothetical protein